MLVYSLACLDDRAPDLAQLGEYSLVALLNDSAVTAGCRCLLC